MIDRLRSLMPKPLLSKYREVKRAINRNKNKKKSTEEVFSEIYEKGMWGGSADDYCSGSGTVHKEIADSYVTALEKLAGELKFSELRAVDLGCGDMRIGRRIAPLFESYLGIDIVKKLVDHHNEKLATDSISFAHLDIVEDELPDGDLCLIREVLQHLSNKQIQRILEKVRNKYKYVLITEHLPSSNPGLKKNLDKAHGADLRLYDNSGVFLTAPPFDVPASQIRTVLEVEGHGFENYDEPWIRGVIQTVLYTPQAEPGSNAA